MKNEIVGFLSTISAIIIFLSLRYFYKHRFEENMLEGKQRMVGIVILIISLTVAVVLML